MNSSMSSFVMLVVLMITVTAVSAQTFQYSRGWTNGKRSSFTGDMELSIIDRLLANPCQLEKLRYILQGKPLNEKLLVPCDLLTMGPSENEPEATRMRLRRSAPEPRNQEQGPDFI